MVEMRDKFTIIVFIITYVIIFLQLWIVIITDDLDENGSYLFYHKLYFYFLLIMIIWSQIRCVFTDPGMINSKNNPTVLEFYLNIHDLAIRRAEKFNSTYGEAFFKNISEDDEESKNLNDEDEEISDEDECEYNPVTSVSDDVMNSIITEYKTKLKRCFQCYVVRPPRGHHCSFCKGCVLKMDHHCPWVNNCIGFFNRKYFMQFIFYLELLFIYDFIFTLIYLVPEFKIVIKDRHKINLVGFILVCLNYIPIFIITILFGKFVLYHIKLVLTNSSTIESLDQENKDKYKRFCLSPKENFEQVFGKNKIFWFLPVINEQAKPVGDGLLWKVNNDVINLNDMNPQNNN